MTDYRPSINVPPFDGESRQASEVWTLRKGNATGARLGEIERRVRKNLGDWRSLITGDVAQARQGFRRLLTTPILFTPFVKNGRRGIRFEGESARMHCSAGW